jgi:hypothetical protein
MKKLMENWNNSFNWDIEDLKKVIKENLSIGNKIVHLDTEHCSHSNELQLVKWCKELGFNAELKPNDECVMVYLKK